MSNNKNKHERKILIPVRDNIPLPIFYPEEENRKRNKEEEEKYLHEGLKKADKNQIIQQFPPVQNQQSDLFFAEKAILKINNGKKFNGAVALTLHFVGFFRYNSDYSYSKIKCVHIFDIYSTRIKQSNKTLLYCRIDNGEGRNSDILNVHIKSRDAIRFTQILNRNYVLSTVAYDSYETYDFRTYDPSLFPPFDNGLSPSQGYQLTYFCFCSRLNLPYNHEFTRFYHEHICNFDGFFDFSLIFDANNLKPALYAMMFVPYVMAIICHRIKIKNISQSIELIIKRSNFLRALHLSGCDIDQDGIKRMGDALLENLKIYKARINSRNPKYADYLEKYPIPIPVKYWNFENNKLIDATSFFQGLKDPAFTADVFYLSFSNCQIQDISGLFSAISTNPHLHQIKYLYFNGNQKVEPVEMEIFIKHLKYLSDYLKLPERKQKVKKCLYERIGISGKGKALEKLLQTLIDLEYPIKELSLAGSTIDRSQKTQFYTSSRGAAAIINFFNHANQLEVVDLSSIDCDKQDLSLILQGMNRSQMLKRIHVKLNNIKKSEKDYEPLLSAAKAFLYTNLDKWESLEFAENYLNAFELDFLLSIFYKMKNLKMLNLSYNFHKSDLAVGSVLFKLHELNLTKLYLAGSIENDRYLPKQTFDLLTKLIEQGLLEELDISGNKMGNKCYEFAMEILNKCPNINTLILDQNMPNNFELFDDLIRLAMKKRNLIYFPFPSRDLMYIFNHCKGVENFNDDKLSQFRWYLIDLRYKCIDKINSHRAKVGLPPQLPFKAVPELGEMVNEVHEEMMRLLQSIKYNVHGGIAIDINVPLPFLYENQDLENIPNMPDSVPDDCDPKEIIDKYHAEHIFKRIDEFKVNKRDDEINSIRKELLRINSRFRSDSNNDSDSNKSTDPNKSTDSSNDSNSQRDHGSNKNNDTQNSKKNKDGKYDENPKGGKGNRNNQNDNQSFDKKKLNENSPDGNSDNNNSDDGSQGNSENYGSEDSENDERKSHSRSHHHGSGHRHKRRRKRHHHHHKHHKHHRREDDEDDNNNNDDDEQDEGDGGYDDDNDNGDGDYNDDQDNDGDGGYNDYDGKIHEYERNKKNEMKRKATWGPRSPGSPASPKGSKSQPPYSRSDEVGYYDDDDNDNDDDDDSDYGGSGQEYDDVESDPDDPAYQMKPKNITKRKRELSGYDNTSDNFNVVSKYTGKRSKENLPSSAVEKSPPPFSPKRK